MKLAACDAGLRLRGHGDSAAARRLNFFQGPGDTAATVRSVQGYGLRYDVLINRGFLDVKIAPGAFRSFPAFDSERQPVPMLWQHDTSAPIGRITAARSDAVGLYIEADFHQTVTPVARQAGALLAAGLVTGLSAGIDVVNAEFNDDGDEQPERLEMTVTEARLVEVSLVTLPAFGAARVENGATKSGVAFHQNSVYMGKMEQAAARLEAAARKRK